MSVTNHQLNVCGSSFTAGKWHQIIILIIFLMYFSLSLECYYMYFERILRWWPSEALSRLVLWHIFFKDC